MIVSKRRLIVIVNKSINHLFRLQMISSTPFSRYHQHTTLLSSTTFSYSFLFLALFFSLLVTLGSIAAMDHAPIFRCCKCSVLCCRHFNILNGSILRFSTIMCSSSVSVSMMNTLNLFHVICCVIFFHCCQLGSNTKK